MQFGLKEFRLRDQSIKCCAFFVFNLAYHHVDHPKRPFVDKSLRLVRSCCIWALPGCSSQEDSSGVKERRPRLTDEPTREEMLAR